MKPACASALRTNNVSYQFPHQLVPGTWTSSKNERPGLPGARPKTSSITNWSQEGAYFTPKVIRVYT